MCYILTTCGINPLRPNSYLSQTSHCNIKVLSVSEVMRIENMITQMLLWSLLVPASYLPGLIGSKDFKGLYQKYIDNERDEEAADTATGVLARRNLSPGPVRQVFVTEPRHKHHHHHHRRHHHHHNTSEKC